ncbi:NACHT domain- and WD repeat-containing protein 1-like [Ruditapes philippinarum]|uniref:NACHT domain- and WD repeat-containing protein 1-like n=1 Tax=Ruditapes philippinarum TaxID=129788 RepID=UPI00295A58F9|nr:NACHT domain- and WD repeat-containing protein 1-like [Ruditapes philippinarum]
MYKRYVLTVEKIGCSSSQPIQQGNKTSGPRNASEKKTDKSTDKPQKTGASDVTTKDGTQTKRTFTEQQTAEYPEEKEESKVSQEDVLKTKALVGCIDMECPSQAKIVRIFTSSTFTDTKQERNMLMKFAYPKLKEYCRKVGYEFQVVDMRWGIRDEATDDHMTTELCLNELKLCQKLSTGPNFVSLLSHKYGYTPFKRVIESGEFEKIFNNVEDKGAKDLFQKWYRKDDNSVPPTYILLSVSTHIPDFLSEDKEKKKIAKNKWLEESQIMQEALSGTAKKVFDEETARKYLQSVTEKETEEGLKPNMAKDHFLWLNRNIKDIEKQESSYALSRYIECIGPEEKVQRARQMLRELKEDKLKKRLDPSKILNYSVNWSATGIDPNSSEEHKTYLESMCNDFVHHMIGMVEKSVAEKEKVTDPLIEECLQHIRFCQSKCEGFTGRGETLKQIKSYVTSSGAGGNQPLVLHGTSGTGKTSILAKAAEMIRLWMNKPTVIILRFLGTSPDSSDLMSLLYSICCQIRRVYNLRPLPRTQDITVQISDFELMMKESRPNLPLVLILDSLDQLDHAYNARQMTWLLPKLAPTTKVILSTLPEPIYQCFPALQSEITAPENLIHVPVLETTDVKSILDKWLEMRNRKLTDEQTQMILKGFEKCPTPLFLKLSFEESTTWTSFYSPEKTVLQSTVRESIEHLFEKLEKMHGKILVTRALSYLTLAHNGASEAELEDILSCDDDVLNDVYMYWTPPIRRLPPLLIVRVRNDLSQYLVERGADGTRVMSWYHRQFTEAAEARYCSDPEQNKVIHSNLADFFNGTWANGIKKRFTTSNGQTGEEDRHVSAQPLKYGKNYNIRALSNLPYHRIKAGHGNLLEQQCLANIPFLLSKIEAMPLTATLNDFVSAIEVFPDNELIKMIYDSMLLSQKGLVTDPGQIVPQLLGRLQENDVNKGFIAQCRVYPKTFIEPEERILERPGGQLVHCVAAHKADIDMMDITKDGNLVVTVCARSHEISLWDIKTGQQKRKILGKKRCMTALFCCGDKLIACVTDKTVLVEEVVTGKLYCTANIPADPTICVAGKDKTFLLAFKQTACFLYDLQDNGKLIKQLIHPEKMKFGGLSLTDCTENYVAVTDFCQRFISVLDLKSMTFIKKFKGSVITYDKDGKGKWQEVLTLAIHPDETHLAFITLFTSEIIFADFHGNKIRNVPDNGYRMFETVDFTPDGKHFFVQTFNHLIFFNTATLNEIDVLDQSYDLVAAKTVDMKTVITVANDRNLRIWDRTRSKQSTTDRGDYNFSQKIKALRNIWSLGSTRYIFVDGRATNALSYEDRLFGVYDCITDQFLKLRRMVGSYGVSHIDATRVLLYLNRTLVFVFNLNTMNVQTKLQFFRCKPMQLVIPTHRNQLICLTKAGKNLKVYDLSTGKVVCVLKAGQTMTLNFFDVNSTGTVACASSDEGPLILYDLVDQNVMYTIPSKPAYSDLFGLYKWINADGTRLIFSTTGMLPDMKGGYSVDHLVVWDIQNKKELFRMYDSVYQIKYMEQTKMEATTSVDRLCQLDDKRLITLNRDNIPRVYHLDTGKLLNRLEGHTMSVGLHTTSVRLEIHEKSPYILTYDEACIRLWEKTTCKQVATFSPDQTINNVLWSGCGRFFYTTSEDPVKIVRWKIHNGYKEMSDISFNEDSQSIFSSEAEFEPLEIDILEDVEFPVEEGDPDDDVEVPSDDEDDKCC